MARPLTKTSATAVAEPLPAPPRVDVQQRPTRPVQLWALLGAVIVAFELYVWIRWLTGPYFKAVPSGPSSPPAAMKVILSVWTGVICAGFPVSIYFFLIRPWRRERRITLDGMLLISCAFLFFQDPLLNYIKPFSTYNTWMWNRGAWTAYVPGWSSFEKPGAQVAEPFLMNAPGYAFGVLLCTMLGCWFMRKFKARWPQLSNAGLIGVTFVWAVLFDVVMEGFFLMPMGLFTYPGAIKGLSINAGHYYQWPVYEGFMWGAVQTGLCSIRFFTNDRGQTFVEKGLETVPGGVIRQQFTRMLALIAVTSTAFFVFYNIPVQLFALHQQSWPADITKRSYFLDGICGQGSGRACPDPSLPASTNGSGYIDENGKFVVPKGVTIPKTVPVVHGNS
jgi:hypothetical protein